ncbi:hypothetical protein CRG98_018695 [Punica granatum]|uniref:Uncharacterized protein n=1 Tax=Punica granatum TaxID=22663 RepID=A0A2I0JX66_PUNGR|nr:hypothetical protein CRG98_018695 [Punica granatum]
MLACPTPPNQRDWEVEDRLLSPDCLRFPVAPAVSPSLPLLSSFEQTTICYGLLSASLLRITAVGASHRYYMSARGSVGHGALSRLSSDLLFFIRGWRLRFVMVLLYDASPWCSSTTWVAELHCHGRRVPWCF